MINQIIYLENNGIFNSIESLEFYLNSKINQEKIIDLTNNPNEINASELIIIEPIFHDKAIDYYLRPYFLMKKTNIIGIPIINQIIINPIIG